MDNQPASVCIRRRPFQVRCDFDDCDECEGIILDLTNLQSDSVPPMLAQQILDQLPKKEEFKSNSSTNYGHTTPEEIDWDLLSARGIVISSF